MSPPTSRRRLVAHLAEEQQRDVKVLRLNPLHVGAGPRQRLLQGDQAVADDLVEADGDEGA